VSSSAQTERPQRDEAAFTLSQRISLWFIVNLATLLIRLLGATLRFEVSSEDELSDATTLPHDSSIAVFWHRAIIGAVYFFRARGIAIMTSRSSDGEYIARTSSKLGFLPVRGSSSRGAVSALLGMNKVIEDGGIAAFTIDGPRGPKYVAKPGPVLVAKKTGAPIRCFYVAVSHGWALSSWDEFVIPRPFARVCIRWSAKIAVPADSNEQQMATFHDQMQAALERVTEFAQKAVGSRL
jgi:lysophospholipid acyltransferase (LPLAT)-like uncharacterized protein